MAMLKFSSRLFFAVLLSCAAFAPPIAAADPANAGPSPLGVRQQRVEQLVDSLERRFSTLIQALQPTEPERAARLKATLDEVKTMVLQERVGDVVKMLDKADLEAASERQQVILTDIRKLLSLLLDQRERTSAEEFERLEEWKRAALQILFDERGQRREAERLADADRTIADLTARARAIEALVEKQQSIIELTKVALNEGIQGLALVADRQHALSKAAITVADQVSREAGDSGRNRAATASSEASRATSDTPSRPFEPGEKQLLEAIGRQTAAVQKLQQGKGKEAQIDEQSALESLQDALAALKRENSRMESLPPDVFQQMAGRQDDTADRLAIFYNSMEQANSQAADGSRHISASGQQRLQQSQRAMREAVDDLRDAKVDEAANRQGEAIRELNEAIREIEERLAQLREETQIEKLARLETQFREMLARQQKATVETANFERKRIAEGELRRGDRLAVARIAAEEKSLAGAAQLALDIVVDDGTSVVFPNLIQQVRDDLLGVAAVIEEKRLDAYTQSLQQEIERSLAELIAALQQSQQKKQGSGGGGRGGGKGEAPLLPPSAELKLLQASQLTINRRTAAIDAARAPGALDPMLQAEISDIANRQAEISEMTHTMLERNAGRSNP